MAIDLQATLKTLTAQPTTSYPFLSIYLDWTPDGNGRRPSLMILEQELDRIGAELAGEPEPRQSFEADREQIMTYVSREAPDEAKGLAIFACYGEAVWMPLPLQVSVETQVIADRYPHIFDLARISDDYETFAVVLADGQDAQIMVFALNEGELAGETEASERIKRFSEGGQAQMLFQRRTQNLVKAHGKEIAAELDKVIDRYNVQHVIVSTNDSVKAAVVGQLSQKANALLVDTINLDKSAASMQAVMDAIAPMMEQVERQQEADAVAELEEQNYPDGLGVVGVGDTAMALFKGQVRTLLVLGSFAGEGSECTSCGMLRPGQRQRCPYDGSEMQPVNLREALAARAIQQGAAIQVVENSDYLAKHEGLGALLRYNDKARGA